MFPDITNGKSTSPGNPQHRDRRRQAGRGLWRVRQVGAFYLMSDKGVKVCASHPSTMTERRTESYLPLLKNTEYTSRLARSEATLLKQIIHGADEIGLAAIGPATSNGSAICSVPAAFFRSEMTVDM